MLSHTVSQQKASMAQTASQHAVSSQPGVPLATQQSPSPGHGSGCGHSVLAQSVPSPWKAPPALVHSEMVKLSQEPSSKQQAPKSSHSGVHSWPASFAQMPSHATSQQNGSTAHTVSQQTSSLQPGVPLASQQSPSPGHGSGCGHSTVAQLVSSPW
jgi:hypothetical protein